MIEESIDEFNELKDLTRKLVDQFAKKPIINKKCVDDLFKIGSADLSWVYSGFFFPNTIPHQINLFNNLNSKKEIGLTTKIKCNIWLFLLRTYLRINESIKIKRAQKITSFSKNAKALFLTFTNHVSPDNKVYRTQRVIDELKTKSSIEPLVLYADPLSRRSYSFLSSVKSLNGYYDKKIAKEASSLSNKLFKKYKSIPESTKIKLMEFSNISYWKYYKYAFNLYFSKEFLYFTFLYYFTFQKIFRKENVQAIVFTGSISLHEKCIMAAAKKTGIPMVYIPHGIYVTLQKLIVPTHICVSSKLMSKTLSKKEIRNHHLVNTGSVTLDEIFPFIRPKQKSGKNVLIATSPFFDDNFFSKHAYIKKIEKIISDIQKWEGVKIVFKLHPRDTLLKEYQNLKKKHIELSIKLFDGNISRHEYYHLINECDCFIQFGSATVFEALIIGRPVVTIRMIDSDALTGWLEKDKITFVTNYKQDVLLTVNKAIKENYKLKKRISKCMNLHHGTIDGKASKRVVNLIKSVVKN